MWAFLAARNSFSAALVSRFDFLTLAASALRSALREDPDVILVGEMRDINTMATAVTAAETGHLIFSTLHTNSAAATFSRLIDMGIEPYLIAGAVGVVALEHLVHRTSATEHVDHGAALRIVAQAGVAAVIQVDVNQHGTASPPT